MAGQGKTVSFCPFAATTKGRPKARPSGKLDPLPWNRQA